MKNFNIALHTIALTSLFALGNLIIFAPDLLNKPNAFPGENDSNDVGNNIGMMTPNPQPYQVEYYDGTRSPKIRVRVKGALTSPSSIIYEETLEGYTVIQGTGEKYVYVDIDDKTGNFIETNLIAGIDNPSKLRKGAASRRYDILKQREELHSPPTKIDKESISHGYERSETTNVTLKYLVVPIRFSNHKNKILPTRYDLDVLMNSEVPHLEICPTGSVRDFFLKNSFNKLDINSTVVDWVSIDFTESYCANNESGRDVQFFDCLTNALDKVVESGINLKDFDSDENDLIDGIIFFHSGYAADFGGIDINGTAIESRIWSHKGSMQLSDWRNDGVKVDDYLVSSALWNTSGSDIARIGVIAHEIGYFLNLPDLYDSGNNQYGRGNGIGSYGLMGDSWGFDVTQQYPSHLSAWSKKELGWVKPRIIKRSGSYTLSRACDNADMIVINKGYPAGEYLLMENRQPCGFDQKISQGGIAIFHIDEKSVNLRGYPGQTGWPANGNHYKVALLQADAEYNLEKENNTGDNSDLFHGDFVTSIGPKGITGSKTAFHPNTNAYQNGNIFETGVIIKDIGTAGSSISFNLTVPDKFHKQGFKGSIVCGEVIQGYMEEAENMYGNNVGGHFYSITVRSKVTIIFDSCQSDFDTYLTVYDVETGNIILSNDDFCGQQARVIDDFSPGNYYIMIEGYQASSGNYSFAMNCSSEHLQTGRSQTDLFSIYGVEDTIECGETVTGNTENGIDTISNPNISPEHFFSFSISRETAVTFDSCTSEFDTFITVFDNTFNKLAFNDDSDCGNKSVLSINLEAGEYYMMIEGYYYYSGPYTIEMVCTSFPSVVPTKTPIQLATGHPSRQTTEPSMILSSKPSERPSMHPTDYPSRVTTEPSMIPSNKPSEGPSMSPTGHPSRITNEPSMIQSRTPSKEPSIIFPLQSIEGPITCDQTVTGTTRRKEHFHGNGSPEHFFSFSLHVPTNITLSACGSKYDTFLRVYEAETGNQIAYNDDFSTEPCYFQSLIRAELPMGKYYVMIEGYERASGEYEIVMTCDSIYMTPTAFPSMSPTGQPSLLTSEPSMIPSSTTSESPSMEFPLQRIEGSIKCDETVLGLTLGAANNHGEDSNEHFYSFSLSTRDRIQFDSCNSDFDTIIRIYDANTHDQVAFNDDSNSCGSQSNITMSLSKGDYYVMIEGFGNDSGSYELKMKCQISNNIPSYVQDSIECDQNAVGNTETGIDQYGNPSPEHFYQFTLLNRQTVTFRACASDFDTYITIYDENENQVAYNDDACGLKSILHIDLEGGVYYLLIEGYKMALGDYNITMKCGPYITNQPSQNPTRYQSFIPSAMPTSDPSIPPSAEPSDIVLVSPSIISTHQPSFNPSFIPSPIPSSRPSSIPSSVLTSDRSISPSKKPSILPTYQSSLNHSLKPSPILSSNLSSVPSAVPVSVSSAHPSNILSTVPYASPTYQPSLNHSLKPSPIPSSTPSSTPSIVMTSDPSIPPSDEPSDIASVPSSVKPTYQPSLNHSLNPSPIPSSNLSSVPSAVPVSVYSTHPSHLLSAVPSTVPSTVPTYQPSLNHSSKPSPILSSNSSVPSSISSSIPSARPSHKPPDNLSAAPSVASSVVPTYQQSLNHSLKPSPIPSSKLSSVPIAMPASAPSIYPSDTTSNIPSVGQSALPTTLSSSLSSVFPSHDSSVLPSLLPTMIPSLTPFTSLTEKLTCPQAKIEGKTFYGKAEGLCWKIELTPGGLLTTSNDSEETACSEETFNGTVIKSKFEFFHDDTAYWSKSSYELGGEMKFVESGEVSRTTIELISLRGNRRFDVLVKLPACRVT